MYIPEKYYDNVIPILRQRLHATNTFHKLSDLIHSKMIAVDTFGGIESKKYDSNGTIPFIRTSDICRFEISTDTTLKITEATYLELPEAKRDHVAGDILFVKECSVGSLAMFTAHNTRVALQGHFYRIRVLDARICNPYLLLHCLNTGFVKAQAKHLTFKQVTIPTIGQRFMDIEIAIPRDVNECKRRSELIENIINIKAKIDKNVREEFESIDEITI